MKLFAILKDKCGGNKSSLDPPIETLDVLYLIWKNLENKNALFQDHMFRIDPSKVEDGKGKSPYDPRHNSASVLVGKP